MPRHQHHSWPFASSISQFEEMHSASRKSNSRSPWLQRKSTDFSRNAADTINRPSTPDLLLYSSSDEDIPWSAGIVEAKSETRRRRRKARRERSKRRKREQERGIGRGSITDTEAHDSAEENIVSSITEASEAPGAKLRRYVWPHLEKARQLLIPAHTFHNLTWYWSSHSTTPSDIDSSHGNKLKYASRLASTSTPALTGTSSPTDDDNLVIDEWSLRPGRRHRRCHSEQPRAWREPSPGLWTLAEE